ncbi:MAG TPA: low temperature requirement protein A [Nevskiaceae bacterium]|nr:low temperature requirement protein A [Nevskiaceae bacterium]
MSDRNLLRDREGHDSSRVSYAELFFDLVFVLAVTQLSHTLLHHFTPEGALHTLVLMLAVWWVWIYTSWVTNWLDPEQLPVRLALLTLMLLGLVLSASIPQAFEARGLSFALAFVGMQVGRSLFFLWAVRGHEKLVPNFQRMLVWLTASGVFWIAGAFVEHHERLALWVVALAIEYVGPSAYFWVPVLGRSTTGDWDIAGGHLAERCALFVIIALGESILVIGATFAKMDWTPVAAASFAVSFVGSLAMWWLYFDAVADRGSRAIDRSRDPGRLARLAYTYIHLLPVAGIIVTAVADEFVLEHPTGHVEPGVAAVILGGPAAYVFGLFLFRWAIFKHAPRGGMVALVALALLVPLADIVTPLVLSSLATTVLLVLAAWDAKRAAAQS